MEGKEEVKLLMTSLSPFAGRIVWALNLKGVEFEAIEQDLSNKSSLLLQHNPVHQKIPVLIHNGDSVSESLVILEYIDHVWNQTCPLLPADPHQRAHARFLAKFVDDKVVTSMWIAMTLKGKAGEEEVVAMQEANENLKVLEKELEGGDNSKYLFGGEKIGVVDLTFGSFVIFIEALEEVKGIAQNEKMIDGDKFPLLVKWKEELCRVPAISNHLPPAHQLAAAVQAGRL